MRHMATIAALAALAVPTVAFSYPDPGSQAEGNKTEVAQAEVARAEAAEELAAFKSVAGAYSMGVAKAEGTERDGYLEDSSLGVVVLEVASNSAGV